MAPTATAEGGQVALVTGGTEGIGRETARGLADRAFSVTIVGRDPNRGRDAVADLERTCGTGRVEFFPADLSRLKEVRRLAEAFRAKHRRLDVLVHSAGVIGAQRELTEDGIELNFAVNYLSRFLLTKLLLAELGAAAPSRVVVVAAAGFNGDIHFDDPTLASRFRTLRALTQSQQANDLFTVEMARRLEGTGVTINVLNPGLVDTRIRREMHWLLRFLMERVFGRFWMMTPAEGARMPLRLALDPEFAGVSGGLFNHRGKRLRPAARVEDPMMGVRLWELSKRLCGEHFPP